MIHSRCYPVLDFWVVEVSCVHGDPLASHLVYREELRQPSQVSLSDVLAVLSEVAHAAAVRVRHGEIWESDDCCL